MGDASEGAAHLAERSEPGRECLGCA
jgi:hypothetical protein